MGKSSRSRNFKSALFFFAAPQSNHSSSLWPLFDVSQLDMLRRSIALGHRVPIGSNATALASSWGIATAVQRRLSAQVSRVQIYSLAASSGPLTLSVATILRRPSQTRERRYPEL